MRYKDVNFNYIGKLNDESCKFLYNIYTKLCMNINEKVDQQYLIKNKCTYNSKIHNIVTFCKTEGKAIFAVTNKNDERYVELKAECEKYNIPIVLIDNEHKFSRSVINTVKNDKINSIFLNINLEVFRKWYNWDVVIENHFESCLKKFQSIEFKDIQNNPSKCALQCILNKNINDKKYRQKDKLDLVSFIKRLDKSFEYAFKNDEKTLANIYSSNECLSKYYIYELAELINTLTYRNMTERYEYIYDLICLKLEYDIDKYGYCLFENDKCIAQRELQKWPENEYNGCCFNINKKQECEHLNCKQCDIKCVSCRLFTCKYLKDRGVDYNIHKNMHARCFLSILQRPELVWNFFTDKEIIINNMSKYSINKKRKKYKIITNKGA